MRTSNWVICLGRGENKKYVKPPSSFVACLGDGFGWLLVFLDRGRRLILLWVGKFYECFLPTPSSKLGHSVQSGVPSSLKEKWELATHILLVSFSRELFGKGDLPSMKLTWDP